MSTPENPETPALTRRQLRELRQTGATPIITPQSDTDDAVEPEAPTRALPEVTTDEVRSDEVRSGEVASDDAAAADVSSVEAGSAEPTRDASADASGSAADEPTVASDAPAEAEPVNDMPAAPVESRPAESPLRPAAFEPVFGDHGGDFGVSGLTRRQVRAQEKIRTAAVPIISPDLEPAQPRQSAPAARADDADQPLQAIFRPAAPEAPEQPAHDEVDVPVASVVNPALGSELLDGATPDVELPASFDQLIARSSAATGAVSTPNALILSQTPTGVPLVGPVTATGEVMITGTFELPEGLGSVGHAPGTTDGRDADAVLLDGELPPASSPTPIAASAAISTVKQPGDIIRPPAPEKGSKLLVALIITTGILALGVAVALGLAFTTGVFR